MGVTPFGGDLPSAVKLKTTLHVGLSLKTLRITNNDTRPRSQRDSYDNLNYKTTPIQN
ncbi:hypothetical protein GCM10007107_00740 [Shewanella indica]|nr:hypothetical protein GCM10007107_00740 [Shewanella indica]